MEFWLFMMVLLLIIIGLFLSTKIYIVLICKRNHSNDFIKIEVYAVKKLLLYRMQIPMIDIMKGKKLLWIKSKIITDKQQNKTSAQRVEKKYIKNYMIPPSQLKHLLKKMRYYTRLYAKVMDKTFKSLHCEKFCWKTSYGTEDASLTAIAVGMLWAVKSLLLTNLRRKVSFESKPLLYVTPVFGRNDLSIDFECIFSIRVGNVITTMKSLYRVKG